MVTSHPSKFTISFSYPDPFAVMLMGSYSLLAIHAIMTNIGCLR